MKHIVGTRIYVEKPRIRQVGLTSTQLAETMKNKRHTMGLPTGLYIINNIRKDESDMVYTLQTDNNELHYLVFESVKLADEFIDRWIVS